MEKRVGIERIPVSALWAVPLICAMLNASFLLLLRGHRLEMSDFDAGGVCGVLVGMQLLCALVWWMRMKLEA